MSQNRSIFEEVSGKKTDEEVPKGGLIDAGRKEGRPLMRGWLVVLFALVTMMVAFGGLNRFSDTGFSVAQWNPDRITMPPMTEAAWNEELLKYQQFPEFGAQNEGMTLADFKSAYRWEWGQGQFGPLIGLVWAIGFVGFAVSGGMARGWAGRLSVLGAMCVAQGGIGWRLASSGFLGRIGDGPPYWVAIQTGLAFAVLGMILWFLLTLGRSDLDLMQSRRDRGRRLFGITTGLMHLVFLQILIGALLAGIDMGRSFTDWPLGVTTSRVVAR